MAGLAIAMLFMLMVAAPCLVAMRTSRKLDDVDHFEPEEFEFEIAGPAEAPISEPRVRAAGGSLQTLAVEAEIEAVMARDRAERAHWEALTAAARAAGLRADAAAEAAQAASRAAERAMAAAEAEFDYEIDYLPGNHPSLDFPRAAVTPRRAA